MTLGPELQVRSKVDSVQHDEEVEKILEHYHRRNLLEIDDRPYAYTNVGSVTMRDGQMILRGERYDSIKDILPKLSEADKNLIYKANSVVFSCNGNKYIFGLTSPNLDDYDEWGLNGHRNDRYDALKLAQLAVRKILEQNAVIQDLHKRIESLEETLGYVPGGSSYCEAQERFYDSVITSK